MNKINKTLPAAQSFPYVGPNFPLKKETIIPIIACSPGSSFAGIMTLNLAAHHGPRQAPAQKSTHNRAADMVPVTNDWKTTNNGRRPCFIDEIGK